MIIILEENTGTTELTEQVVTVYEVADYNIPSGINESSFTAAGQLIVALSASTPTVLDVSPADGLVLTSNPTNPKKMEWRAPAGGGGGGGLLTNKRGSGVSTGNVLILDNDNDAAFKTTTTDNDRRRTSAIMQRVPR
jgi:hypothetical protein